MSGWERRIVWPVADAVAAGYEDHGDGCDAGDEERVVIGAADHFFEKQYFVLCRFCSISLDDMRGRIALLRSICVDLFFGDGDLATLRHVDVVATDGFHHGFGD